jgi:hypothetical protein
MNMVAQDRAAAVAAIIEGWINVAATPDAAEWYGLTLRKIASAGDARTLAAAMGLAPRRLGKADLHPDAPQRQALEEARPGFDATDLSLDQLARIGFVLAASHRPEEGFALLFDDICRTAEVGELIAAYRGLPLYPAAGHLLPRAREGLRSGMKPVFEAVAHRSPYPREMLDEHAWNQMVLKALFVDSTLAPIQGLDARGNRDLAETLIDYARERWAARRPVSAELWRCVFPFVGREQLAGLKVEAERANDPVGQRAIDGFLSGRSEPAERL